MLSAPTQKRERILLYGEAGSGKSSAWVSIANWIVKSKSDAKIYLFDSDYSYEAMYDESFDSVVEVVNVDVNEFELWAKKLREVRPKLKRDDWLVVDMIDKAWTGAQNWYWRSVGGGDSIGEVYLRARTEPGFDVGGAYGANWGDINRLYDDFMSLFINAPCHKLACTPARQVMVNPQSGLAINKNDVEWVRYQYKPVGQNRLSHGFHTILLAREIPSTKGSEYNLTTVKERGPVGKTRRSELRGEKVPEGNGFVGTYLVKVAGWKL